MESNQMNSEQLSEHKIRSCDEWDVGGGSFSPSFMSRNQDISFGNGSPACDAQSPTFTCRNSFSSFMAEPVTPLVSGGFSFRSTGDSIGLEFSTPVSSMLSFSFLSPSSVVEQKSCKLGCSENMSDVTAIVGEATIGKLLLQPDSPLCNVHDAKEEMERKPVESKRAGHKALGMHSKRNRTIGLGECVQLDLVVTESVIRWSSCTQLPTSLRSSLVC